MKIITLLITRGIALLGIVAALCATNPPVSAARSDAANFAAIDAYIEAQMKNLSLPGLALGVVQGDQIVHLQSFGIADPSGRKITPQTPFLLASLTKSFTALAIMQLVEAGQVELDAPVQRYLPWFSVADPDASARITVRHLLNQTSGLSILTGNGFLYTPDSSEPDPERLVRSLSTANLAYPVGQSWQYSNANYVTLGMILETVSGLSYEEYVQKHIFTPLDMPNSFVSLQKARQRGMAMGYQIRFGVPIPVELPVPHAYVATGGMISSAEDMAHYLTAFLNQGRYRNTSVLSPARITQLWQSPLPFSPERPMRYAMGWYAGSPYNRSGIDHSGSSGNFHAHMAVVPQSGWGVVVLINADHAALLTPPVQAMTWGVVSLLLDQPLPDQSGSTFTNGIYLGTFVIVALQFLTLVWAGFRLRRWSRDLASRPSGLRRIILRVVLPILLNLLAVYIFVIGLPQALGWPFAAVLHYVPDWGYAFLLSGVLGIGWLIWGITTVVVLRRLRPPHPSEAGSLQILSNKNAD